MKLKLARLAFILLIWGLTSIATLVALWRTICDEWDAVLDELRLQDRAASAALWDDGRYTVSANCGVRGLFKDCRFCRFVRRLLGDAHVDGASRNEIPIEGAGGS